jgi:hypothetical protein
LMISRDMAIDLKVVQCIEGGKQVYVKNARLVPIRFMRHVPLR